MADSTLDLDTIPLPDRQLGKGHGTDALGPSDRSDTGSDVQGGFAGADEELIAGVSTDVTSRSDIGIDRIERMMSDEDGIDDSDIDPEALVLVSDGQPGGAEADGDGNALPDDDA